MILNLRPLLARQYLVILLPLLSCDLENRYPNAGEFCTPMKEIPECVHMDFRNKTLVTKVDKIQLTMVNRVQYEYKLDNQKWEIDLLSEHRIRIRKINLPEIKFFNEEIYLRTKEPKVSIWSRIQKIREGK